MKGFNMCQYIETLDSDTYSGFNKTATYCQYIDNTLNPGLIDATIDAYDLF